MQSGCMFPSLPFLAIITPLLTDCLQIYTFITKNWVLSWNENNEFTAIANALNILRSDKVFRQFLQARVATVVTALLSSVRSSQGRGSLYDEVIFLIKIEGSIKTNNAHSSIMER